MAAPARFGGINYFVRQLLRFVFWSALGLSGIDSCLAAKWAPVDPQELAEKTPRVDPEAGAEILFREVTVRHVSIAEYVRTYHVRAKIFSERGLEHFAKVDLPYGEGATISEVQVRTIKPGGEIIELTKKDIFEREVMKAGRDRVKVKSFSPAGLQTGAIVEYVYKEVTPGWAWYVMMLFQSDLPTRHARLNFSSEASLPAAVFGQLNARALFFNCPQQSMQRNKQGFYTFEMRNLPAAKDEPFQPPLIHVQSGVLICYSLEEQLKPKAYWAKFGQTLHERMMRETKPTKQIRTTLELIVTASDSEEEKLQKIYDYCRGKLVNRYSDAAQFTREQRAKFVDNENASQTLKHGHGTLEDINAAFVALARAAGFDARYASANNRSAIFFQAGVTEPFMASDLIAAVRTGDKWRYFDPGTRYLPFATPHWQNTATAVIVAAPKDAAPALVGFSDAEVSREVRTADLELEPDGTLAGTIKIEHTGHRGFKMKTLLDGKTAPERETHVRDEIQEYLKFAEVTAIKVEHADDPIVPLAISYHLRVPGYADRTGSRLFFQPAVFQKNHPQLFPEAKRKSSIIFPYCSAEIDSIRIKLPEGFELEQAAAPAKLDLGDFARYITKIGVSKESLLIYNRSFALQIPNVSASAYAAVREAFELVHQHDAHTLTLKRKETIAPGPEPRATEAAVSAR